MSSIPANAQGLAGNKRVMVTQYNGTCDYCGRDTIAGVDFFAYAHDGGKVSACAGCAISVPAMILGVCQRIGKVQDTLTEAQLATLEMPLNYEAAIGGQLSPAETQRVLGEIQALWLTIGRMTDPRAAAVEALRAALPALAGTKNASFANSLVDQYDTRGRLSDKQWPWVEKLAAQAAGKAAAPVVDQGIYVFDNGDIWRIYETQNGRLGARQYNGVVFDYVKGGVAIVAKVLAAGECHILTEEEAKAWGLAHDLCLSCLSIGKPGYLTDDRSLAVGYGAKCASNHGWWYPSNDEAAAILRDRS